jgi:hypothetical protein
MAEFTTEPTPSSHRLPWLLLGLVVAAHFGFNLLCNPIGAPVSAAAKWRGLMLVGAIIGQPALFAIWTSLGPGPTSGRLLLTTTAFMIVVFGEYYIGWNLLARTGGSNWGDAEFLVFPAAVYAVCAMGMIMVRKFAGWRITRLYDVRTSKSTARQFSMKFILGYTAVCAALLGAGQLLASSRQFGSRADPLASILAQIGGMLLVILPSFIVPLMALAKRPSVAVAVVLLLLWVALSLLAVETLLNMNPNETRANLIVEVGFVQLGAAIAGLASALLLRLAGYRLVTLPPAERLSSPAA